MSKEGNEVWLVALKPRSQEFSHIVLETLKRELKFLSIMVSDKVP